MTTIDGNAAEYVALLRDLESVLQRILSAATVRSASTGHVLAEFAKQGVSVSAEMVTSALPRLIDTEGKIGNIVVKAQFDPQGRLIGHEFRLS